MKEMMKRAIAFITFEQPISKNDIEMRYQHYCIVNPQSNNAVQLTDARHEIIYEYWYNHVIHFFFLLVVASITTNLAISKISLPSIALAGLLSYVIMYLFCYRVIFNFILLRNVEIIGQEHKYKFDEEIRKCKKIQYSNLALVIIHNANTQLSGMDPLTCNNESSLMLTELYGVDTGSMKKNLELLFMKNKRKHFSERNKTEYKNCFEEAYSYFEKCNCLKGVEKVKKFETVFFSE